MSCIGHMLQSLEGMGCKDSVGGVMRHGSMISWFSVGYTQHIIGPGRKNLEPGKT